MKVHFVQNLPVPGQGSYIDFYSRDYGLLGWNGIDISRKISSLQDEFLSSIEKWHVELCERGARQFRRWWLMPASRLTLRLPSIYKSLLFSIAAAEEINGSSCHELYMVGCPEEVAEYLCEFCPDLNIHASRKKPSSHLQKARRMLAMFRFIFEVLVHILFHRRRKPVAGAASPVIAFSFGLFPGSGQKIQDHHFGDMLDPALFKRPVHWVYHDPRGMNNEACSSIRSSGDRSFVYDWIGISGWLSLVGFCFSEGLFRHTNLEVPDFVMNGYVSRSFARDFADEMIEGSVPFDEYTTYIGIKGILKACTPRALVYPYEDKSVERAMLTAIREASADVATIAFAHAVYNKSHMYVRRHKDANANPPAPDKLMVTGPALKEWFVDWAGWDEESIFISGSPRHHKVVQLESTGAFGERRLRLLVLISTGYEAAMLANQLQGSPQALDGFDVIIRPYPYSYQEEQDDAFSRIRGMCKNIIISGGPLAEQLSWCDIAIYCSTTAGLEAMLMGRLTVNLDLNHVFSLNPVGDKFKDAELLQFGNLHELKIFLDQAGKMTKDVYTDMVSNQRGLAGQILQEVDYGRMNMFFDNIRGGVA